MRNMVGVLVLFLACGCGAFGKTGDPRCDDEWAEADELNGKAAGNGEGTCNACGTMTCVGTLGVWAVEQDREGKRDLNEDQSCEVVWGEVAFSERDSVRNSMCPEPGK